MIFECGPALAVRTQSCGYCKIFTLWCDFCWLTQGAHVFNLMEYVYLVFKSL
ncbi:hypothetical protein HanIR_Chr17g0887751 [Helianthus annuus]|nr:hypothetical protein HanIR_Chr17g0887751 [Helianthus annuus]